MTASNILLIVVGVVVVAALVRHFAKPKQMVFIPSGKRSVGQSLSIGKRELQEDTTGHSNAQEGDLLVLADGRGRAYGGRISSRLAVQACLDLFSASSAGAFEKPHYFLRHAMNSANRAIVEELGDERAGAALAVVLAQASDYNGISKVWYALAGNVKVAVFRDGDLIPITEGHTISTLAKHRWKEGRISREEALRMMPNTRTYNFVGQDGFRNIETFPNPLDLKSGDILVLMSDGIFECISWRDIESVLSKKYSASAQDIAYAIIERVNISDKVEDKDNASVILMKM